MEILLLVVLLALIKSSFELNNLIAFLIEVPKLNKKFLFLVVPLCIPITLNESISKIGAPDEPSSVLQK